MKLTVNTKVLAEAVQALNTIIGGKTTLPILNFLRLTADVGVLRITATNLEQTLTVKLAANVETAGAVTLPAKQLAATMKTVSAEETHLEEQANLRTELMIGPSRFVLNGLDPTEFPSTPLIAGEQQTVNAHELTLALKSVAFAMSEDENRFILNSALFECNDTDIHIVATDGRRLAKNQIKAQNSLPARTAIIPRNAINEIIKIFSGGEAMTISFDQEKVAFVSNQYELLSRLIDGTYPNYKQVIPNEERFFAEVQRTEFSETILRAAVVTTDKSSSVKLTFTPNNLHLHALTPDLGEVEDNIPCKFNGEQISIGFNPNYLNDPLKVLVHDTIRIGLSDELSPAVMHADDYLYVIMPMRLT